MNTFRKIWLLGLVLLALKGLSQPRLLVTPNAMDQIREKIKTAPWAERSWERIKQHCDSLLQEELKVPPRGGSWSHYYVSPDDGQVLKTGKQIAEWQWEHLSTQTGKAYYGDPSNLVTDYDGVTLFYYHHKLANTTAMLGFAYQVSGEEQYAKKAIELLRDYTRKYPKYPIRDKNGLSDINAWTGAGRVHVQSLGESLWTLQLAIGTDFVWDKLTLNDRQVLYDSLFRPATDLIIAHHMRDEIHNIECWKNSAVAAVGFLYDNTFLINSALSDTTRGYYRQLNEGLTSEGLWWEMAPSYHFYSFYPLWVVTQMAENYGIKMNWSGIRKMLSGPLLMANSQLELPQMNDSKPVNLEKYAPYYDLGYGRFRDKKFLAVLKGHKRSSVPHFEGQFMELPILYGAHHLPKSQVQPTKSANLTGSGVSILRSGAGLDQLNVTLKYMNPDGWHSHPDILGFSIYKGKHQLLVDPGHGRYSSYLHQGWYKTSVAHNTVVLNQSNQEVMGVKGKCLAFDSLTNYGVYQTSEGYDNFEFTRAVMVIDENTLLLFDQIKTTGKDTIDLALHMEGEWNDRPVGEPLDFDANGYKYLKEPRITKAKKEFRLSTTTGSVPVYMATSLARYSSCITADGVDANGVKVPAVIFRNTGNFQAAAHLIALDGRQPQIRLKQIDNAGVYRVEIEKNGESIQIGVNLTGKEVKYKGRNYSKAYIQYL
ncbi:alginate lyase family protein [Fulvivirga sp. M361]|uniref:heparinase II/III domain-containing protein n=1 Tax=Fulvivirga sp. M361 TaxID=2594266 RepID=UPI001179EF62|nr:heparinase II/III family protein [Fulvivirga sp. M361]TRX60161.1 alginate lyase family protein [Fulvivirga sp. M361]